MLLGLLALARAPGELPVAEVAVGDERAQAERLAPSQRLSEMSFGLVVVGRITTSGDLPKKPERPCLVASLPHRP